MLGGALGHRRDGISAHEANLAITKIAGTNACSKLNFRTAHAVGLMRLSTLSERMFTRSIAVYVVKDIPNATTGEDEWWRQGPTAESTPLGLSYG